ncbi:hypothetical protein BGZ58_010275 [Dissophora ornata]|nr:hypothetical protein BGZ58_010275 [Dissophora ornata]
MSSAINTLLQYFLIVSVAYLYTKMPWNKKNSSSTMGGTLGKLHASGLTDYYAGEKKRAQLVKKKNHPESAVEQTQKGRTVVDGNSTIGNKDGATKEAVMRESTRVKDRSQQQQQRRQGSVDSTASQKKQTKRSSSGSPPPLAKQKSNAATKTDKADTTKRLQQQQQSDAASSTSKSQTAEDPLPIPAEEAAKHRRFLSEMFKDVPISEIDRVIRSANWDVDEAATLLAQEDYTWQSVRRRRSVPG